MSERVGEEARARPGAAATPVPAAAVKKLRVGWREWVALPDLGVHRMIAKLDTGAYTGALHALNIAPFERDGARWVRFDVDPSNRDADALIGCEAPVRGRRHVRSSSGEMELRYVIRTRLVLGRRRWSVELTLTDRAQMRSRLLLGRRTLRGTEALDFLIDPSRSFLRGRPRRART